MQSHRNEQGLLRGDLDFGSLFPATVNAEIAPVLYPCGNCGGLMFHVLVVQPTGIGFKLPFAKKPLATTGKDFGLVCNSCGVTAGVSGRALFESLERRVVPSEVCIAIDRFLEQFPNAPKAYAEGFTAFVVPRLQGDPNLISTFVAIYSREQ